MSDDNNYRCINCGTKVKDLFHKLSSGLLTCVCSNCNEVVDKYIEHDSVLIFLDALLLKTQAFRHILHNRSRKTVWKITLTFLLIETLARVINSSKVISKWNNPDAEFYTILVTEFLYMFVEVALEQITGVLVIAFLSKMYSNLMKIPHPGMKPLLTGLFFSYFLCNVFIPLVSLWGKNYRSWCCALIQLFIHLSKIQVLRVICNYGYFTATVITLIGYGSQLLLFYSRTGELFRYYIHNIWQLCCYY